MHFFRWQRWTAAAWVALVGLPAGFLVRWPFDDGRIETDRFLDLTEYCWTLAFFALAWVAFLRMAILSRESAFTSPRRILFATLNNALFYFLGVLILPPRYPDWFWKFTVAAGVLFLVAWAFADRYASLRRAFAIHGIHLIALGIASSIIGPQPAAMFAIASAFFVLTVEQRGQSLLRFCAGLTAILAAVFAWEPVYLSKEPSLWLGVITGAPLVVASIWISGHRDLWRRWAVLFFGAIGLGTWLLTTLAQTPAQHHPPILAVEAILVTGSILLLGIAEFPLLATSVLLLAQFLWFQQVGNFNARPWWNPLIVFLCTLGLSWWWQTRGRAIVGGTFVKWFQGIAAIAAIAILLLSIETAFGRSAMVLVALSLVSIVMIAYASAAGDWLLLGFSQLIIATAVGEFIGQLTHAPLPIWLAPLFPITALLGVASMLASPFTRTVWEHPARCVALIYRALAAGMFVAWVLHYISPANRFLALALAAVALLFVHFAKRPNKSLLGPLVSAAGALLAFWLGWTGTHGFQFRDLLAFLLLLSFGQIIRRKNLLPDEVQSVGIILGLLALTQWAENCAGYHHPGLPVAVVWAATAAVIVCSGWWFSERLYRVFGWALLLVALMRVMWSGLVASNLSPGSDPSFRLGLLAVGTAALTAALSYARRTAITGK
jgi:hypothetical protein